MNAQLKRLVGLQTRHIILIKKKTIVASGYLRPSLFIKKINHFFKEMHLPLAG